MTQHSPESSDVSNEDVAKGCRRILGFIVFAWILSGFVIAFFSDNQVGFVDFLVPVGVLAFVAVVVSRARRRKADSGEGAVGPAPVRERTPPRLGTTPGRGRTPPPTSVRPAQSPSSVESKEQRAADVPKGVGSRPATEPPASTSRRVPSRSLEEALEDLGMEPTSESEERASKAPPETRPLSSQEMIEEARKKWGSGRDRTS